MDALLILAGLLLLLSALVWIVILAFETGPLWGWGSLLPPVALVFVLRHWRKARKAVVLAGLACVPLVVGLAQLAARDPERVSAILSLQWLQPPPRAEEALRIDLRGELNGQPFTPQQAELIDGVLTLREGQDFYARRELTIRLRQLSRDGLRLDVLPEDGGRLPQIEISWLLPEQDLPEARQILRGYSLHLDLKPEPPNRLVGDFHLVLPARYKTTLSGTLELYTDRLRYRAGRLDTRFDSLETLSKVVEDYLQRRFAIRRVLLEPLPAVNFPQTAVALTVTAQVEGSPQTLNLQLLKDERKGWQVQGDHYPVLVERAAPPPPPKGVEVSENQPRTAVDRRLRFSLQRLLRNPNHYQNLSMRLLSERGSTVEGRFSGIDKEGRLQIQSQVVGGSAGAASFSIRPEEIRQIELLEP